LTKNKRNKLDEHFLSIDLQTNGTNSSLTAVNDDDLWEWSGCWLTKTGKMKIYLNEVNIWMLPWSADVALNDFSRRSRRRVDTERNSRLAGVISWPANWGVNSSIPMKKKLIFIYSSMTFLKFF